MQETIVSFYCDLCPGNRRRQAETVGRIVGLDGRRVELDLCGEHADALDDALGAVDRLLDSGRPVVPEGRRLSTARPRRRPAADVAAVRAWARANGYEIAARGRIPREVEVAYERARGATAAA
jgi:hypothetical protein